MVIAIIGKFTLANSKPPTRICFLPRISRHSIPASDAEKASEKAPKFTPRAMAYTVPQKVRSLMGVLEAKCMVCQAWITRERRMVVPMFVPANYDQLSAFRLDPSLSPKPSPSIVRYLHYIISR